MSRSRPTTRTQAIRRVLVACCLLHAAFGAGVAAAVSYPCEPSPAVKKALASIEREAETDDLAPLDTLRALRGTHPGDVFVEIAYQSRLERSLGDDPDALVAQYRDRLDRNPDDPISLYLHGRVLSFRNSAEAIASLERALARAPDFPQPHLRLGSIYQRGRGRDERKAVGHLKSYTGSCPSSLSVYDYLSGIEDREFLQSSARTLRGLLEKRSDAGALDYFGTLWDLEFRGRPVDEHAGVRRQVAADLELLRRRNAQKEIAGIAALRQGYEMTGDANRQAWADQQLLRRFPHSREAAELIQEEWLERHVRPGEEAPPEKVRAHNEALLQATRDWIEKWPDEIMPRVRRFGAVRDWDDSPGAEVEASVAGLLNAVEKNSGFHGSPPFAIQAAELFLKREMGLERVPGLVQQGFSEAEMWQRRQDQWEAPAPEARKPLMSSLVSARWAGWPVLVEAHLKLSQPEKAHDLISLMGVAIAEEEPGESATAFERSAHRWHQAIYWRSVAGVAESEGRKLDAMTYYGNALDLEGAEHNAAAGKAAEDTTWKARRLWKDLGGTDGGWQAWLSRPGARGGAQEAESAWDEKRRPMPDFDLNDLDGRRWRLADLKGKTAFINVWAIWCAPCMQELPHVQKLYESLKCRQDLVLLTLNVDSQVGLVEPFIKKEGYTFPVLPAASYVKTEFPDEGIPRNWIVGPDGIWLMEQIGFGGDGEKWMAEALGRLAKAGNPAIPPIPPGQD